MENVTIGTIRTADIGLYLVEKNIPHPPIQTYKVSVPGRAGDLDLTESLAGFPVPENRTITLGFQFAQNGNWSGLSHTLASIHGKRCALTFDDETYVYNGRVSVGAITASGKVGSIVITIDADPYKLKPTVTTVTSSINTTARSITLTNDQRPISPKITTTKEATITFGGASVTISANTPVRLPGIILTEGNNVVSVKTTSGSGSITFEYQEGAL